LKNRIKWGKETGKYGKSWHEAFKKEDCPDCGAKWLSFHNSTGSYICDIEQCPYCKGQLLSCPEHSRLLWPNTKVTEAEKWQEEEELGKGKSTAKKLKDNIEGAVDSIAKSFAKGFKKGMQF
jgi:Zn-finger nucleic acid-binding protein